MRIKYHLLINLIGVGSVLFAQNFIEIDPQPPFQQVSYSSLAFSDVDGDGDEDVIVSGQTESFETTTNLYINDGTGHFSALENAPFKGVYWGDIGFADIDEDNDQDVLITGYVSLNVPETNLYINDGDGNYSQRATPIENVGAGSIAFADVDGDSDQDVLITGDNISGNKVTTLYLNNGSGFFTEVTDVPFDKVKYSSIAFADLDGDNDEDVLIVGLKTNFGSIAKLYLNDGEGEFTEMMNTPFRGVDYCSVALSDVDGDNDLDVFIAGFGSGKGSTILCTNDGLGQFTEISETPFEGVTFCSIDVKDVDGDEDDDLIIAGQTDENVTISKLYVNDGAGHFSEVQNLPFVGVANCSLSFSDVDGDQDYDVLISGRDIMNVRFTKLYINDPMSVTTEDFSKLVRNVSIFPNPTNAILNLNVKLEELNIYNSIGEKMGRFLNVSQLDISDLLPGTYFIKGSNGEKMYQGKFVKM